MVQNEKARDQVRVVAICGSLRPGSYTRLQVALRGARETGAEATLIDLSEYQLIFCDGKENESGYPKDVYLEPSEIAIRGDQFTAVLDGGGGTDS